MPKMKNPPPLVFPTDINTSQGWGTPTDIRNFQSSYGGLGVDGRVGPKTAAAMNTSRGMGMLPTTLPELPSTLGADPRLSTVVPAQGLAKSTAAGRMALRNDDFNSYMGESAGAYGGIPTMADINANPEAFANYDFSKMEAGSLGTDATPDMLGGVTAGDIASGIGAAANLANAYIGYKNYGLAKDKFGFEKAATNRNIENQAQQYNAELQNRGEIGLALGGASVSPEQRANTLAQMERQKISGAAIG